MWISKTSAASLSLLDEWGQASRAEEVGDWSGAGGGGGVRGVAAIKNLSFGPFRNEHDAVTAFDKDTLNDFCRGESPQDYQSER